MLPSGAPYFIFRNLQLNLNDDEKLLHDKLCNKIGVLKEEIHSLKILRKGIDARKKHSIKKVYTVSFSAVNYEEFWQNHTDNPSIELIYPSKPLIFTPVKKNKKITVVGSGPAGLFAALRLLEYGLPVLILERGKVIEERVQDVQNFWGKGILNEESNIQFGEGGAGTFSDGKLTTRVRDKNISYVLNKLVQFGAPSEITFLAKPHIGTDILRNVVISIRKHLVENGVDFRFNTKLSDIKVNSDKISALIINETVEEMTDFLILATGHSARDTYQMLKERGVIMEAKAFAVGARVEHPQELINRIQYGIPEHPELPTADYAVTFNDKVSKRSAYSFCMCPGGVVIAGSSESGGVVTNGMSFYQRNSSWANSALVVGVRPDDFPSSDVLAGVEFQRILEQKAFIMGGKDYSAPAESLLSFIGRKGGSSLKSTYRPRVKSASLRELFPEYVTKTLKDGIIAFDRKMPGFISSEATLIGVESRTSAPLRIVRGEDCQSLSVKGLFPCGEGAGYAGGIVSAALDGIRVADAVVKQCNM